MQNREASSERNHHLATTYQTLLEAYAKAKMHNARQQEAIDNFQIALDQINHPREQSNTHHRHVDEIHRNPNWLTRQFDKRVEAKCKKILQDRIEYLINLKRQHCPDLTKQDITFIEDHVRNMHDDIWDAIKIRIFRYKSFFMLETSGAVFFFAASVALLSTAPFVFALPTLFSILYLTTAAARNWYNLYENLPRNYQNILTEKSAKLTEFAKSPETLQQHIDILVKNMNDLTNNIQGPPVTAPQPVPVPGRHARKRIRHHEASLSLFGSERIGHRHAHVVGIQATNRPKT